MTRPDSPLRRHLLTRSDLAKMAVPAAVVLDWLANGALEPVGTLGDDAEADPVFTVPSPELRRELVMRLASIDKPAVVLTPLRVRSFLLRARMASASTSTPMLSTTHSAATVQQTMASAPSGGTEHLATMADQLAATDLANVLEEIATEVEADLEVMLELAEEEAQIEAEASQPEPAAEAPNQSVAEQTWPGIASGNSEADGVVDEDLVERNNDACFDIDDLAGALGAEDLSTAGPFAADSHDATEPAAEPVAENAPTTPDFDLHTAGADVALPQDEEPMGRDADVALPTAPPPAIPRPAPPTNLMTHQPELLPPAGTSVDDPVTPAPSRPTAAVTTNDGSVGEFSGRPDALDAVLVDLATKPLATWPEVAPGTADPSLTSTVPDTAIAAPPTFVSAPAAATSAPPAPIAASSRSAAENDDSAAALARTDNSLQRVESFLGELKHALVELADRPPPAATDVQPLVAAVQAGFEQATSTSNAALTTLSDRIGDLGQRIEHGSQQAVAAIAARNLAISHARSGDGAHAHTPLMVAGSNRTPVALMALAALVSGWAVLFWFKTGSPQLALGTLIAANLVGCYMLLSRQAR